MIKEDYYSILSKLSSEERQKLDYDMLMYGEVILKEVDGKYIVVDQLTVEVTKWNLENTLKISMTPKKKWMIF